MAKNDRQAEVKRRRRKHGGLYAPVAFLLMALAIIFGLSVFFRVSNITVSGQVVYTSDEIIAASGIELGGNLFFVDDSKAAISITDQLAYVDEVQIIRKLPSTIVIEVTESYPIASIKLDSNYWIIDKNGKLLEKTNSAGAAGTISVSGIVPLEPIVGQKMTVAPENGTQYAYLTAILNVFLTLDMQDQVTWLDMESAANISFDYEDRFTVKLGSGENTDIKLKLLLDVIEQKLDGNDTGTIDLSTDKEAHFTPD